MYRVIKSKASCSQHRKIKKAKAEKTNKNRWLDKKIILTELQPHVEKWFEIYDVIVTEVLFNQQNVTQSSASETGSTVAFSNFQIDNDRNISKTFTVSVADGNNESRDSAFTSLFDIIKNPLSSTKKSNFDAESNIMNVFSCHSSYDNDNLEHKPSSIMYIPTPKSISQAHNCS